MEKAGLDILGSSILPKVLIQPQAGFGPLTAGMWLNREGMGRGAASFLVIPIEVWLQMLPFSNWRGFSCAFPTCIWKWGMPSTCHFWGLGTSHRVMAGWVSPKMLGTRRTLDFVFKMFTCMPWDILNIEPRSKHEICLCLNAFYMCNLKVILFDISSMSVCWW